MNEQCATERRWTVRAVKEDEDGGSPWVQLAPEGSYGSAEEPPDVGEDLVPASTDEAKEEA